MDVEKINKHLARIDDGLHRLGIHESHDNRKALKEAMLILNFINTEMIQKLDTQKQKQ